MIGEEPTNTTPLQKLRAALHGKAKSAPNFRFYALYDKIYRRDVLTEAWRQCRGNGGAPGIDGQTFADIEKSGVEPWLDELTEELRDSSSGDPGRASSRLPSDPSVVASKVSVSGRGIPPISRQPPGQRPGPAGPATLSRQSLVGEPMKHLVREPDAGKPPVRFDEREVETEHGQANETPANERAGNS
jgi:hypothetical protein